MFSSFWATTLSPVEWQMKYVVPGEEGKVHKEGKMEFAHAYLDDAYLYDAHVHRWD